MNCKEVGKYLDAYVDGELEAGLMLDVDSHLARCERCSSQVFVKRQLKSELRDFGRIKAPDHLRKQIVVMAGRRRRTRRIVAFSAAPLAAAAALLVAFFALPEGGEQPDEPLAEVVNDVVQRHTRQLPMEVEGPDPARAASWFRGKVDFPVRAPALNVEKVSFQGARLSNVRTHQAAHMTYNVDGHRVTLMIFNPSTNVLSGGRQVQVAGRTVLLGRRNGFNVAVFLDGDMAYALSSDLPPERLIDLVGSFSK